MRTCPTCGETFEAGSFCPRDGAALLQHTDPLLGTTLLGQFEIVGRLGRGAMGTVYRAWQPSVERPVAVKVLHAGLAGDSTLVKRFAREARAVARLSHPNIVGVHVVGEIDRRPYLVMEYLDGDTLEAALPAAPIKPARAVRIARQVCSALAEAHGEGIVHRDLKPANILLLQRRRSADFVKILDFGIAKILDQDKLGPAESRLTREGAIFGTPAYIAPEQAAGAAIDHRADLYSVGVMLYRMLSGRLPFEGGGVAVMLAHLSRRVPPLAEEIASPELAALVMRCLEKDPDHRYQSAEELADALDGLSSLTPQRGAAPARARSAGPEESAEETARTRPVTAVSGAHPIPARRRRRPIRGALWTCAAAFALLLSAGAAGVAPASGRPVTPALAGSMPAGTEAAPGMAGETEATPAPPRALSPRRAVMMSQDGYSLRVLLPDRLVAGVDHEILVDIWDPAGEPLSAANVVFLHLPPDGAERGVAAQAHALPGRFRFTRRFALSGSHVLRVLPPAGLNPLQVHFDVSDPDA